MSRDLGVTRFLVETRPPGSEPILEVLALPGDLLVIVPAVLLLVLYELVLGRRSSQADRPLVPSQVWSLVAIVLGGLALTVALEALFGFDPPPAEFQAIPARPDAFPSGHTMAATVTWVTIARYYRPNNLPVRLASVAGIVVLVGIARMSLGVHFLPDVLAGMTFGVGYVYLAGRFTYGQPSRAFAIAIVLGTTALILTGTSPGGLLAFGGTVGGLATWRFVEYPPVRRFVRQSSHFRVS